MSPSTTIAPTVGEIARRLGESLHRIEYVIRSRNIQPASRAGHVRIFAEADVAHIADELRQIDARQEQASAHEAPSTGAGGAS
jgi:DNA-binding transcriptional MerR regulator